MLNKISRFVAGFFSVLLLVMGIRWAFDPTGSAEQFQMPLLEGMGLSTQIGDLASFFVVGGLFGLLGVIRGNATLLLTPAALVAFTAVFRTIAWSSHDAAFATDMIVAEIVMCISFMLAYKQLATK